MFSINMTTKQEKLTPKLVVDVVDDDDDEEYLAGVPTNKALSSNRSVSGAAASPTPSSSMHQNLALDSRSFWKAGNYEVGPTKSVFAQGELEHARVHPKFLHSNATSHKWAFGAIAELLDNAVDEINNGATFVKVDRIDIMKDNSPALLFHDDGGGMDPEGIRKCMSLGYSSKKTNTTIGQYGNGFKTSTMRLGADAIVFSRATRDRKATQSIGLLSYTYLRKTGQDDVIVPMVDFDVSNHWAEPIIYSSHEDWSSNLKTILEWSPFTSKEDLMLQFENIGSHGTKVILYNLWLNDEGIYELSFDDDDEDIRLRDEANRGAQSKVQKRVAERQSHISYRIRYSLRAYASILYLQKFKNFQIILRGKPVEQYNIAEDLNHVKVVVYKPQLSAASKEVTVMTTLGLIKEAPTLNVSGYNVYHKNRLIRPYWKVTSDGSSRGSCVVGVLEANFIEPAHDKQDFERSSLFIRLETKLKQMVLDYWKDHCHILGHQIPGTSKSIKKDRPLQPSDRPGVRSMQAQLLRDQRIDGLSANIQNKRHLDQPESSLDVTPVDVVPESLSIDQLCEENIQLFMRCEEHAQKEIELKQTVEDLEKELEEAKRKCALLSAHMKIQKQMNAKKTTEKV